MTPTKYLAWKCRVNGKITDQDIWDAYHQPKPQPVDGVPLVTHSNKSIAGHWGRVIEECKLDPIAAFTSLAPRRKKIRVAFGVAKAMDEQQMNMGAGKMEPSMAQALASIGVKVDQSEVTTNRDRLRNLMKSIYPDVWKPQKRTELRTVISESLMYK